MASNDLQASDLRVCNNTEHQRWKRNQESTSFKINNYEMIDFTPSFSRPALTCLEVGDDAVCTDKVWTQPWLASLTVKGQLYTMLTAQ